MKLDTVKRTLASIFGFLLPVAYLVDNVSVVLRKLSTWMLRL